MRHRIFLLVLVVSFLGCSAPHANVADEHLITPNTLVRDPNTPAEKTAAAIETARLFYTFWDTGERSYLERSISPQFTDRTLPPGRPQGPEGPYVASTGFRKAVPDLRCEVEQLLVVGDRVVAHLRFRGTFTGAFGDRQGTGTKVDFIATDILRIVDHRVTDNWHLEDNLTLMKQLGVVT